MRVSLRRAHIRWLVAPAALLLLTLGLAAASAHARPLAQDAVSVVN